MGAEAVDVDPPVLDDPFRPGQARRRRARSGARRRADRLLSRRAASSMISREEERELRDARERRRNVAGPPANPRRIDKRGVPPQDPRCREFAGGVEPSSAQRRRNPNTPRLGNRFLQVTSLGRRLGALLVSQHRPAPPSSAKIQAKNMNRRRTPSRAPGAVGTHSGILELFRSVAAFSGDNGGERISLDFSRD